MYASIIRKKQKDETLLEQVDWDLLKSRKRDATALASFFRA
nr:MAG TPA: hypothetical protein [Caudoviricetes sp.]